MAEDAAASSAGAAAPARGDSALGRIAGVFFSPVRTFEAIARRPTWIAPFVLWIGVAVAGYVVLMPRLDWHGLIRAQAEKQGQTPTEAQVDDQVARMERVFWIFDVTAAVIAVVGLLGTAAVLYGALQAFGCEVRFVQSLAVTAHAFLPQLIGFLVFIPVVLSVEKVPKESAGDLVRSNLGFLADPKSAATLHSLLQSIDVFSFWCMALLTIGISAAAKVTRGRAAALVLTLWFLFVLGKAGIAAIFG